jgi:hypothetical protein
MDGVTLLIVNDGAGSTVTVVLCVVVVTGHDGLVDVVIVKV